MKGQASAEMLILIVVIMAILAIVATQVISMAKETGLNVQKQSEKINTLTAEAIKSQEGGSCLDDVDCKDGLRCESYKCG